MRTKTLTNYLGGSSEGLSLANFHVFPSSQRATWKEKFLRNVWSPSSSVNFCIPLRAGWFDEVVGAGNPSANHDVQVSLCFLMCTLSACLSVCLSVCSLKLLVSVCLYGPLSLSWSVCLCPSSSCLTCFMCVYWDLHIHILSSKAHVSLLLNLSLSLCLMLFVSVKAMALSSSSLSFCLFRQQISVVMWGLVQIYMHTKDFPSRSGMESRCPPLELLLLFLLVLTFTTRPDIQQSQQQL